MFKKNDRFGGGERRGGNFGGGNRDFRPRNDSRDNRGERGGLEMFDAVCAACNKTCQVPFRPNGRKPVYCKDCFAANGGQVSNNESSGRFAPKREFASAPSYNKPEFRSEPRVESNAGLGELKRQVEAISAKLDRLMDLVIESNAGGSKKVDSGIKIEKVARTTPKKRAVKRFSLKKK